MEWKSLLSGVWRPVSIITPSPKARSTPAVILEPVEASWSRQGPPEAPKTDFWWKSQYILVEFMALPTMNFSQKTCPSRTSTPDLVDEFRNVIKYFFGIHFLWPGEWLFCTNGMQQGVTTGLTGSLKAIMKSNFPKILIFNYVVRGSHRNCRFAATSYRGFPKFSSYLQTINFDICFYRIEFYPFLILLSGVGNTLNNTIPC